MKNPIKNYQLIFKKMNTKKLLVGMLVTLISITTIPFSTQAATLSQTAKQVRVNWHKGKTVAKNSLNKATVSSRIESNRAFDASVQGGDNGTGVTYTAYNASGTIQKNTKIFYSVKDKERLIYTTDRDMTSGSLTGTVPYSNLRKYFPDFGYSSNVTVRIAAPQDVNASNNSFTVTVVNASVNHDNSLKVQTTTSGVRYTAYDASGTLLIGTKIYYSAKGTERLIYTTTRDMKSGELSGEVPFSNLQKYFPGYVKGDQVKVRIESVQDANQNNNVAMTTLAAPTAPTQPNKPVTPVTPTQPTQPTIPTTPTNPVQPKPTKLVVDYNPYFKGFLIITDNWESGDREITKIVFTYKDPKGVKHSYNLTPSLKSESTLKVDNLTAFGAGSGSIEILWKNAKGQTVHTEVKNTIATAQEIDTVDYK